MGQELTVRRYGALNGVGVWTLYEKEVRRFMKVSMQTVFAPVVSTWLFMIVFVYAFGGEDRTIDGLRFADFIAPGLVVMAVLSNAFANSSSSLIVAKIQGTHIDFMMPPLSSLELTIAFLAGAVTRGVVVALAGLASVAMFADITPVHWWAVLYFGFMASTLFAAIGVIGGIWADKFDHLAAIQNFVITPLTFLSGTFYTPAVLPEPFQTLIHWNPVFYIIDGFRYGFTGHADGLLAVGAACTGVLTVALVIACWLVIRSGWRMRA